MFLNEVQVLEGGAPLGELAGAGLALVGGAFEVVLLVVADAGGQQVVHHHNTDVHTAALQYGVH